MHKRQSVRSLLAPSFGPGIAGHSVIPDNVIFLDGKPAAVLDAKYKLWDATQTKPSREDLYQVVTAAALLGAPLAALVYPEALTTRGWVVNTAHHAPQRLLVVGLDLLGFRARDGLQTRGKALWDLLG